MNRRWQAQQVLRAAKCIKAYNSVAVDEDTITDLLTDLRHWSHYNGFNFELAIDRSNDHFMCEITGVKDE